jgi:hypothetical protein
VQNSPTFPCTWSLGRNIRQGTQPVFVLVTSSHLIVTVPAYPLLQADDMTDWTKSFQTMVHGHSAVIPGLYEGESKSFRTGRPERKLQMVCLSATRCSCIAICESVWWVFPPITLYVAFQRLFIVVSVYIVINSVRKLLNTSYSLSSNCSTERIVLLDFIHRLVSQEQTKLRN